jgi:hypothetical protein
VACLVTAATDEGGVAWAERVARTLPLTPACAALGVWASLAPVYARGEGRALQALGQSPARVAAAAIVGAALVPFAAAVAMALLPAIDVAGFYPTAVRADVWHWQAGAFVNPAAGMRVTAEGVPERLATLETVATHLGGIPAGGRLAAAIATALAGTALPMLVGHGVLLRADRTWRARHGREDAVAAAVAIASSILLFQAAAARYCPALVGALPPLALLLWAIRRYRSMS